MPQNPQPSSSPHQAKSLTIISLNSFKLHWVCSARGSPLTNSNIISKTWNMRFCNQVATQLLNEEEGISGFKNIAITKLKLTKNRSKNRIFVCPDRFRWFSVHTRLYETAPSGHSRKCTNWSNYFILKCFHFGPNCDFLSSCELFIYFLQSKQRYIFKVVFEKLLLRISRKIFDQGHTMTNIMILVISHFGKQTKWNAMEQNKKVS